MGEITTHAPVCVVKFVQQILKMGRFLACCLEISNRCLCLHVLGRLWQGRKDGLGLRRRGLSCVRREVFFRPTLCGRFDNRLFFLQFILRNPANLGRVGYRSRLRRAAWDCTLLVSPCRHRTWPADWFAPGVVTGSLAPQPGGGAWGARGSLGGLKALGLTRERVQGPGSWPGGSGPTLGFLRDGIGAPVLRRGACFPGLFGDAVLKPGWGRLFRDRVVCVKTFEPN